MKINAAFTHSQRLEQEYQGKIKSKPIKHLVPKEFHDYLSVFDIKAASRLPVSRPWDHKIDLKEDFVPKSSKVYPLTRAEEALVKDFIDENLKKVYI